ncbi:MAG: bifunctional phosphoglucose/phosphomannose isomerase [Candidatus Nealsonbacteria bacterium]|nr:bifunctional phosphoglucose/phosphomannose isomerase [Candidatus Nealsonbacteria bacterium]
MRQVILDFPKQFRVGLRAAEDCKILNFEFRASNLIICGMGGSALPADILKILLANRQISIHRDYGLPSQVEKNTLIICISYSGNTEETLSAFEEARKKRLKIAAIASGGKLAELCEKYNIPVAIIPKGYQPRMALGFQFAALCGLLGVSLKDISALENLLKPHSLEMQGKKIAEKLSNKIPLIYASRKFKNLARIWKIKFNENSKIPAFHNYFPEMNHNELVGFTSLGERFSAIILKDRTDNPRILKRMKIFYEILKLKKIQTQFIDISGKNILYKIFNNILLSDWVSYYLALQYKIDPTPVGLNDEFKKRLIE